MNETTPPAPGVQPAKLDPADLEALRTTLTRMARIAKALFGVSAADVTLFSDGRIWRASDAEGKLDESDPASYLIAQSGEPMWVEDLTRDARFAKHDAVTGPMSLRFFAGAPIALENGAIVGALGVYDQAPRAHDEKLAARLIDMAGVVGSDFDRIRANRERAEALEKARRAEERFQIAIQGAGLHVYEVDFKARTLFKAGAEDTFFETPRTFEDLSDNERLWAAVHPDDRAAAIKLADEKVARGERWELEYRIARNDGKDVWARSTVAMIQDARGRIVRLVGALQNITAQKTSERDLTEAKARAEDDAARLGFALEAGKGAAWEIDLTKETIVNGEGLGKLGWRAVTEDDIRTMSDAFVYQADRPLILKFIEGLRTGRIAEIEYRLAKPDGSLGWVRTIGRARGIDKEKQTAERLIFLSTDITERKRAEQEFGQSMKQAAASLKSKRSLLAAIARDIGVDETTAPALAPDAEIETLRVDDVTNFSDLYDRLSALLSEIDARDQALVGAVESLRNARSAAEQANLAKSQFLAMMSHELRTPLNAVIGYAEILEEDLVGDGKDDGAADARKIYRAARNLLELINEVLDFSKIEAGRMEIKPEPVEVKPILLNALETVRHLAETHGNTLDAKLDPAIDLMVLDEARLRQCLLNLLSNACKFTENGRVSLRAEVKDGMLVMDVVDTGCGISAEEGVRLFQPFAQVDNSHTRKKDGTGLGLVITRRLAELMGGDLNFISEPGKGSTFTLRVSTDQLGAEIDDTGGDFPIIAVIEDDNHACELVRRTLAHLPVRVRTARTAQGGVRMLAELKPALIVLDIHLPDGSGWDLLAQFKADPMLADVPVLVQTIDDDRTRALAMGACEHVRKPIDRDRLLELAQRHALNPDAPPTDQAAA
jgi:signal transduction histidine kinase/ActR/RegA family two-component response regulator